MQDMTTAMRNLDRILSGEPIAQVYNTETRSWWDLVDDNAVEDTILNDDFQAYVRLIEAIS